MVIFNANADKTAIEGLANGSYQVLAADGKVYSDDAIANVDLAEGASYEAGALSATVLKLDSSTKPDTDSAPVIKGLVASDSVTLGSKFDPMSGVSAWDEVDGDLTDKITVEGSVDTSKEGEYTLVYSVTNSRGKTATFTRTVTRAQNPRSSQLPTRRAMLCKARILVPPSPVSHWPRWLLPSHPCSRSRPPAERRTDLISQ